MRKKEQGSVTLIAVVVLVALVGLSVAYLSLTAGQNAAASAGFESDRAGYIAEGGLAEAVRQLNAGLAPSQIQADFAGGQYTVSVVNLGNDGVDNDEDGMFDELDEQSTRLITSSGSYSDSTRTWEGSAWSGLAPIYQNAIFAGNSADTKNYKMEFAGTGHEGDVVNGDIYANGHIVVQGDATINGNVMASGTLSGIKGEKGTQEIPDLAGMNYAQDCDVNVNDEFAAGGVSATWDGQGGTTVPEDNLAHIFRKNPSNRETENNSTPRDDYYLEDAYEPRQTHNDYVSVDPAGNNKVYFVDGDLWVNGHPTFDYKVSKGARMTIVCQGDIHVCDNLFFSDPDNDGIAFIAMNHPDDPDGEWSGNVRIGDPVFGTIEELNCFLYAENTFYDENLDEEGSYLFEINGNMTAGNKVSMHRDFKGKGHWEGSWRNKKWVQGGMIHSAMTVNYDGRLRTGDLLLPGLPIGNSGSGIWTLLYRREVGS